MTEATFFLARDGEVPKTARGVREIRARVLARMLSRYPVKAGEDPYWSEVGIRTDSRFLLGARTQLRGMSTVSSKAWEYYFTYVPESARDPKRGAAHARN